MKHIQLKLQVSKSFGDVEVIPALDLDIEDSEFVVCRPFRLWQVHLAASDRRP